MPSPSQSSGHTWRTGTRTSSSLTEHLRYVTESAANAAVENYTSDDEGELLWAAVSAGLAVEAVLKFSIAKANPVLLADSRGGTASAVLLARHTTTAFAPLALKTITGMAAFSIFRVLAVCSALRRGHLPHLAITALSLRFFGGGGTERSFHPHHFWKEISWVTRAATSDGR